MSFPNYAKLKKTVEMQYDDRNNTSKYNIFYRKDPFLFNLFRAVKLVEEFGRRLEDYIYFRKKGPSDDNKYAYEVGGGKSSTLLLVPGRMDACECPISRLVAMCVIIAQ